MKSIFAVGLWATTGQRAPCRHPGDLTTPNHEMHAMGLFKPSHANLTRQRATFWWATMALVAGLTACGGGGGGGDTSGGGTPAAQDLSGRNYVPANVGNRWVYTDSDSTVPVIVKVTRSDTVDGQSGVIVHSTDDSGDALLVASAQGVKQVPADGSDELTLAIGAVDLLRYPLHVGDSFTAVDKSLGAVLDFDGDGIADATSVKGTTLMVGLETIVTPVGTLADCLHVRSTTVYTIQLSAQKRTITLTQTSDNLLAPGIGPVRSTQVLASEGTSSTFTREIAAYGIGASRSETVAPSASATALTGANALGPATTVDLSFSEDMDQDTLSAALGVWDAGGRKIDGSVSVSARAIHFTPAAAWTSGSYSARLSTTATDLVGNPASAASWDFVIDATAPGIVGTQPLEGAVDVPLASAIVLQFSEAVLVSSVNASTIQVLYDGSGLTQLTYQTTGSTVTLTPQTGLLRGKPYSLSVTGVTDLAGNPIAPAQLHFTTDPGRFGAPQALPALPAGLSIGAAVAIGDVTGDARPDVVMAVRQPFDELGRSQSQLAVFAQQADGSLASPVLISLQVAAPAGGITIADVNADGLNDVLVAEGDFGVEIFLQTSEGRLVADRVLNTGTTSILRLADMNGDGRPDIVSYGANVVGIWLNLPGGWSAGDSATVTSYASASDLSVGDINGDGRPDIVFAGPQMPDFAAAGILKQGADGHLLAPEWLFSSGHDAASRLLVVDVDGDGRKDLVLAVQPGLSVALQQADGTLAPMTVIDDALFPGTPKLVDINGDGRVDLVTVDGSGNLGVRLRRSDGTWSTRAVYPGNFLGTAPTSDGLVVGDIDSDGRPDVVVAGVRFVQRPVPVNSESLRPGAAPGAANALTRRIRSALRGPAAAR